MEFNVKEHILALDFDGVIGNSVNECLIVAYNAYYGLEGDDRISSPEALDDSLVDTFKRIRNYIRAGADFLFILLAIEKGVEINNQQDFDRFANEHKERWQGFFDSFYRVREDISSNHLDLWLELNPMYEGMADYMLNFPVKENLYIITTKKIDFVIKLLANRNITLVQENLFTADKQRSKRSILLDIQQKHQLPADQIWYVDDQVDTLLKIKDTNIRCVMAEWGYNDQEQQNKGINAGLKLMGLHEFRNTFRYIA